MLQLGVSFQWGEALVRHPSAWNENIAECTGPANARMPGVRGFPKTKMRTLPDYLRGGMKLIIVGCNPGDRSARVGHYYAGRGNEFWPLLYDSGVVPELLDHRDDKRMIEFGIGLTDLVKRPTRGIEELKREEFAEGRIVLSQKLEQFAPQVIAFNGVGTFENFAQRKCKPGLQKERLYGAQVFVLPSTSAKNATGRAPKLRYFRQLAKVLGKLQN
jgi:mismatch-specific thymine-DNA glycosylase